jgi:hypothetical protein
MHMTVWIRKSALVPVSRQFSTLAIDDSGFKAHGKPGEPILFLPGGTRLEKMLLLFGDGTVNAVLEGVLEADCPWASCVWVRPMTWPEP